MDAQFNEHNLYIDDPKTKYWCSPINKSKGFTLLHKLILYNHKHDQYDQIKQLITRQPELINKPNKHGWTALMIACTNSRKYQTLNIIKLLLKCPCINVNTQQNTGWSCLMIAARNSTTYSNIETVRLLLDHPGIDVNLINMYSHTALTLAVRDLDAGSDIETIELLLKNGVDMNYVNRDDGMTPLLTIAFRTKRESDALAVKLFLEHDVNVNFMSRAGRTTLMYAVTDEDPISIQIVKLLLSDSKCDIDFANNDGETALGRAIYYKRMGMIDLLCSYGASLANTKYTLDELTKDGKFDIVKIIESFDMPTKGVMNDDNNKN